jgi:HD-GYP domain-containing protein (c-di-GMP phosphodiesterase class II)
VWIDYKEIWLADVQCPCLETPYKKAFFHSEVVKNIQEGKRMQFDPMLTDVFVAVSGNERKGW